MKMNKIIYMLILILSVVSVLAIEECKQEVNPNEGCAVITPITVNASNHNQVFTGQICTYDLYAPNGSLMTNDGIMTNGSYGVGRHNFTFKESVTGIWSVDILCNQSSTYGRDSVLITVGSENVTLDDTSLDSIDLRLNDSHSGGNWTGKSGTASISTADKNEIANLTWQFDLTGLTLTRWMAGYYLDRIYRYP